MRMAYYLSGLPLPNPFSFSLVTQPCLTLCNFSTPVFPVHNQFPELAQTHVHQVSDAIQPSHPLLLPSPLAFSLSLHQGLFQWVSSLHQVAWVLEFQLQPQDWCPLGWTFLAVQGTVKSLLQHHSSKAWILWCSAFFIVQLSHPYMTTGKTIALTRWNFVNKVMSLCFNMLSRLIMTFLPRSKCLLISWLQPSSAVIWEPPKNKVCHFPLFPHLFAMKSSLTMFLMLDTYVMLPVFHSHIYMFFPLF